MITKSDARKLLAESSKRRNLMYSLMETLWELRQNSRDDESSHTAVTLHIARTKALIAKSSENMGKLMEIVSDKG